jgi:chromosome segregation ATPase
MSDTIESLRKYNLWRRGDESINQPDPKDIGIWIDEICEITEKLERERDDAQKNLKITQEAFVKAKVGRVEALRERDEARDMVEKLTEQGLDLMDANRMLKRERDEAIQRRMETILQCELLKNERDEAREDLEFRRGLYKVQEEYLETARRERDEVREQNAKLRNVAERAIEDFNGCKAQQLRAELDQLKEGAK